MTIERNTIHLDADENDDMKLIKPIYHEQGDNEKN